MNKKEMNNKGFSLVELIIVIAIMAILVGVLAPQFIKYVERSRESTDLQNIEEAKVAVEAYVADQSPSGDKITVELSSSALSIKNGTDDLLGSGKPMADSGLSASAKLKSGKWVNGSTSASIKWNYSLSTYSWEIDSSSATHADAFNVDGSQYVSGSSGS